MSRSVLSRFRRPLLVIVAIVSVVAGAMLTPGFAQLGLSPTTFSPGQTISSATFTQLMTNISSKALNRTGGTMTGALLFSADNAHDIGAAGATRPRDLHVSRNALVGGTLGVTGASTFAALSATTGTFSGAVSATGFSGSGASLTGIPETAITDGALLARLAAADTVTGAWTFSTTPSVSFSSASLHINNTTATVDNRAWFWRTIGNTLNLTACNDASSVCAEALTVSRSGATPTSVTFFTGLQQQGALPDFDFLETGVAADTGRWDVIADGGVFVLRAMNDVHTSGSTVFSVSRSGQTAQVFNLHSAVAFSGTISASLGGVGQNDWAPAGIGAASHIRVTTGGGSPAVTGIAAGQTDGRVLTLNTVSGSTWTIPHSSGLSTAANQICTPGSTTYIVSGLHASVILRFDGTDQCWKVIGGTQ